MQQHILGEQNPNSFVSENFIDFHCCICFVGCSFGLPVSCSLVSLLKMGVRIELTWPSEFIFHQKTPTVFVLYLTSIGALLRNFLVILCAILHTTVKIDIVINLPQNFFTSRVLRKH
jgi:hypothetical protein